jgi:hypothetical protein
MRPYLWHIIHVVSFLGSLLGLSGILALLAEVAPEEWRRVSGVCLVAGVIIHYLSDPRRPWVLPRGEEAT